MSPAAAKPGTRTQKSGTGHSHFMDGQKVPGSTTVLSNGIPKPALVGWAAGAVGDFVVDRLQIKDGHVIADEVLDDLETIERERGYALPPWRTDKKIARGKVGYAIKGLPYRERDAAGNRGTEVHRLAEKLAAGEKVEVPEELVGHVDSYLRFRDEWEPYDEVTEFTCINRPMRYMGIADLEARLRRGEDLGRCFIDLKTNRSGPFGEVGLQIASYRFCPSRLDPDGVEEPMPTFDTALCLWIRADGYDLIPFQAGEPEYRMFLYAKEVADFCLGQGPESKRPDWVRWRPVKGDALKPPVAKAKAS